jgi:hypothetical protein
MGLIEEVKKIVRETVDGAEAKVSVADEACSRTANAADAKTQAAESVKVEIGFARNSDALGMLNRTAGDFGLTAEQMAKVAIVEGLRLIAVRRREFERGVSGLR